MAQFLPFVLLCGDTQTVFPSNLPVSFPAAILPFFNTLEESEGPKTELGQDDWCPPIPCDSQCCGFLWWSPQETDCVTLQVEISWWVEGLVMKESFPSMLPAPKAFSIMSSPVIKDAHPSICNSSSNHLVLLIATRKQDERRHSAMMFQLLHDCTKHTCRKFSPGSILTRIHTSDDVWI